MDSRMKGKTVMEVGGDSVAVITLINPPVNSLSFNVLYGLKSNYEEALSRDDVKAIVITGAKGKFSRGFDISGFGEIQKGTMKEPKVGYISIDILTDLLEAARKPSVAAIEGLALGGGLELSMEKKSNGKNRKWKLWRSYSVDSWKGFTGKNRSESEGLDSSNIYSATVVTVLRVDLQA